MIGIKTLFMLALGFAVIYGINAVCIVTAGGTVTIGGMLP